MSSIGYCFNICRTVDKHITQEQRPSVCNPIPPNTGALIFGHRFSLINIILPNINSSSQQQNNLSSDQD